jgi:PAS domain S-box-containing protein
MALAAGLPATAVALAMLWSGAYSARLQWTLTLLVVAFLVGFSLALRERLVTSLRTLSNLLGALREQDYSLRARGANSTEAWGEVLLEVNALSATLREQRLGAQEATALLRKVMEEIDVAIFAFDSRQQLQLVNRAGERLLALPGERLLGRSAEELGLAECLQGEAQRTLERPFPGTPRGAVRWGLRRSTFREGGLPHDLIVLADLSRPLRQEERQAWQRLIRVLGHELNNSLAPIKSMAATLQAFFSRQERPEDWEADLERGLEVISARAEGLSRFMEAYARLARLPQPRLRPVQVPQLLNRVAELETRMKVSLKPGPPVTIQADGDQLEQLLINIVRNAADAALETGGDVLVGWHRDTQGLEITVSDNGPGLANTTNLFVPFFTTKPSGSGIGLVLSRQIAEAHGGSLTLENRPEVSGCVAKLRLPLS